MVSRVFRIPFRGHVAPEKGILNMSDIILYVLQISGKNIILMTTVRHIVKIKRASGGELIIISMKLCMGENSS